MLPVIFWSLSLTRPQRVSSPGHVARSVPISRTIRSCTLQSKGYETYLMGSTAVTDDRDVTRYSERVPDRTLTFLELIDTLKLACVTCDSYPVRPGGRGRRRVRTAPVSARQRTAAMGARLRCACIRLP